MGPLKGGMLVVISIALFAPALGDENGSHSSRHTECGIHYCQRNTVPDYNTWQFRDALKDSLLYCVAFLNHGFEEVLATDNVENYKSYFRRTCISLPVVRKCLDWESTKWEVSCHNETMHKIFNIGKDVLLDALEVGCVGEGEQMANILYQFQIQTNSVTDPDDLSHPRRVLDDCLDAPIARLKVVDASLADISSKIWYLYTELPVLKECIVTEEIMRGVMEKVKCIHPQNGSLVLCKSIDSSLIDRAGMCPLDTKDSGHLGLMLEKLFTKHAVENGEPHLQLEDAETLEEVERRVGVFCSNTSSLELGLVGVESLARICLHEPERNIINLLLDYFKVAVDASCSDQGRRVSSIYFRAKQLKDNATGDNALVQCIEEVKEARDQDYTNPARLLHYYQELTTIKDCVDKKVETDDAFNSDLEAFVDEIKRKMKCINPEDGHIVLCETLAH